MSTQSQKRFTIISPINDSSGRRRPGLLTPTGLPSGDHALQMGARNSTSTVVGDAYSNEIAWLKNWLKAVAS